jgi:hypothetical protein
MEYVSEWGIKMNSPLFETDVFEVSGTQNHVIRPTFKVAKHEVIPGEGILLYGEDNDKCLMILIDGYKTCS